MGGVYIANPIIALILSFIIPGLGQLYNRDYIKGIVLIILAILFGYLYANILFYLIILYIIIWLYGMYDAYTTAKTSQ